MTEKINLQEPKSPTLKVSGKTSNINAGAPDATSTYVPLKARLMVQLAAPHTWTASILPVLLAVALTIAFGYSVSISLALVLLVICILMQSAVNTFNDYYDFVKGADSIENQDDPEDAVLVYNKVNPRSVLVFAIVLLVCAFALGIYVVIAAGWIPLALGLLGAAIIVLYSAGKSPISYLPIGEYVSGIAMGAIMMFACYYALTQSPDFWVLLLSLPLVLGIGLIMFTNNTCDVEKDIEAGRKTQAIVLGRPRARTAYHATLLIWIGTITLLVGIFFTPGLVVVPFMLLILYPTLNALWRNPLNAQTRGPAMMSCLNLNIGFGVFYCFAIIVGAFAHLVL